MTYGAGECYVVENVHGMWVMDCFGGQCWTPAVSPCAEFKTKAAAERAATAHRKEHAEEDRAESERWSGCCPRCGARPEHQPSPSGQVAYR